MKACLCQSRISLKNSKRHTFACWALSSGANPNFVANQMGHTSSQMVYSVYGKWMSENNSNQMDILNARFTGDAPRHITVMRFSINFKQLSSPARLIQDMVLPVDHFAFSYCDMAY
ncbi:phage integrase family protein [Yersinia ruckeri]|nr:phage integrase family protein [Yersinia ruckeri]